MRRALLVGAVFALALCLPAVALGHETTTPSPTPTPTPTPTVTPTVIASPAAAPSAAPSLVVAPVVASPAQGPDTPSILRPESPGGSDIKTLTIQILVILSGVAITVWVVLTIVVVRGRRRRESEVKQTHGNLTIEIIWTAIPAVIIAVLFFLTIRTTGELAIPASTRVHFAATGHRWWWEFEFAGATFKTANEIHLPVEQTVSADLLSTDVIHSYWVPQMGGKVDMIPGHINRIAFTPATIGTFLGECSEYCGHQHANMRFLVFVDSSADFARWFADQQLPAREPTGAEAVAGGEFITTMACGGCHTIRGTSLAGTKGPDLTHFGSRTSLAAVTLRNTPENLTRWLTDPQAVKPESLMPRIQMPADRIAQLVAYLEELK
jgi:cytochrome c oxidase subunit 2